MKDFFKYASGAEIAIIVVLAAFIAFFGIPIFVRDFNDVWEWWVK